MYVCVRVACAWLGCTHECQVEEYMVKREGEGGREGGREGDLIKVSAILEMTVHLSWMGWPSYFMSLVTVSSDVMQEPAVDQIGRVIRISNNTPMQGSHVPHTEMNR